MDGISGQEIGQPEVTILLNRQKFLENRKQILNNLVMMYYYEITNIHMFTVCIGRHASDQSDKISDQISVTDRVPHQSSASEFRIRSAAEING